MDHRAPRGDEKRGPGEPMVFWLAPGQADALEAYQRLIERLKEIDSQREPNRMSAPNDDRS